MTDALSSMEYPHWLIIAGAILLVLGLVGLALRARSVEADPVEADPGVMTNDQEPSEPEADLTPEEVYDRTAKEKRRARRAEREHTLKEPASDGPSILDEESK
jgi:hypothetical protein